MCVCVCGMYEASQQAFPECMHVCVHARVCVCVVSMGHANEFFLSVCTCVCICACVCVQSV